MFSSRLSLILLILLVLSNVRLCGCEAFENGNEDYRQERYEVALSEYQKCLEKPVFALFYNMGNTYFKLQKYGLARVYYEKARLASPGNRNLRFNLDLLQEKLIDEESADSREELHLSQVRTLQVLTIIVALYGFCYLRRAVIGSWVYRLILVFMLVFIFLCRHSLINSSERGVVVSPEASLFSNRNQTSTITARLHEGKILRILEEAPEWLLVEPEIGIQGWIPRDSVGRI